MCEASSRDESPMAPPGRAASWSATVLRDRNVSATTLDTSSVKSSASSAPLSPPTSLAAGVAVLDILIASSSSPTSVLKDPSVAVDPTDAARWRVVSQPCMDPVSLATSKSQLYASLLSLAPSPPADSMDMCFTHRHACTYTCIKAYSRAYAQFSAAHIVTRLPRHTNRGAALALRDNVTSVHPRDDRMTAMLID